MAKLFANSGDPEQTPHPAASDLVLHYLPLTLLGNSIVKWVNVRTEKTLKKNPVDFTVRYWQLHGCERIYHNLCGRL